MSGAGRENVMNQDSIQNKPSDRLSPVQRLIGAFVRIIPFKYSNAPRQPSDPMIKIRSGRHEASLPLSLVRRIVEEAEPRAFYNDVQVVRMDAGHLFKILQQMDVDAMSKQTRRAMVEAIDVSRSEEHTSELQSLMR